MAIKGKIAVLGLGYVGLANAAVLSEDHHLSVVGFDTDAQRIAALRKGDFYLKEPKLNEVLKKNQKRLDYQNDSACLKDCFAYFIAVGTPSGEDGSADLSALWTAVSLIKSSAQNDAFVIIRSTVPVGTGKQVQAQLAESSHHFIVVSMPEFLAEGRSYEDEKTPARFVMGSSDGKGFDFIKNLRKDAVKEGIPFYEMSNESAELTKYASNIFLAMKISYINELSRLAEKDGANIEDVALAMGADPRIGHAMLHAGIGYGGACLPKDGKALLFDAQKQGVTLLLPEASAAINLTQPLYFLKKITAAFPSFKDVRIALLGLAYKAGTADIRNSPSLVLAEYLLKDGATLVGYDPSPLAREAFRKALPEMTIVNTLDEAIEGSSALVFLSADDSFANLNENDLIAKMKGRYLFDGRNLYPVHHFRYFTYVSVGREESQPSLGK